MRFVTARRRPFVVEKLVLDFEGVAEKPLWIDAIRLVFMDGITTISSPTFTTPEAIWPEKPRKSGFGRTTYWTGSRKSIRFRSLPM